MASVRSPSSPPASASASPSSSASSSDDSATQPISPSPENPHVEAAGVNNGALTVDEKKPDISAYIDDLHSVDHIEKFKKYEANYGRWLTAKYFSKKNLHGGDIFDDNIKIQGEIIKSSRWPCTRSYADPVQGFEEQNNSCSTSTATAETSSNINGMHLAKKSS